MKLVVGNRNYSSWSMRVGVLVRGLALPCEEVMLRLPARPDSPFHAAIARYSPAGRVPVLVFDDGFAVWDTLAIAEALHERFPAAGVWPADGRARARARSLCAEMHAGFGALRQHCPMNIEADLAAAGAQVWAAQPGVRRDVARVESMWLDALAAGGGPMLFGSFGAADAFYAPVVMRMLTYALPLQPAVRDYAQRVAALPAVAGWIAQARAEHDFIAADEPYRAAPT